MIDALPVPIEQSQLPDGFDFEEYQNWIQNLDDDGIREYIGHVAEILKTQPGVEIPIRHHFAPGLYAREMLAPKGSLIVGKIHKHQNIVIISSGDVSILSIDGPMRVKGPFTYIAQPGAQRLIVVHEDTYWTTLHHTNETDLAKIEAELFTENFDEVIPLLKETKNTEVHSCHQS